METLGTELENLSLENWGENKQKILCQFEIS